MLDQTTVEFVARFRDAVLFCRDSAGGARRVPHDDCRACSESVLVFTTYRKSAKVSHLQRDPRVCVLAWDRADPSPGRVQWASVTGRSRLVSPSEAQIRETFGPVGSSDGRVPGPMSAHVQQRLRDGKRVLIFVEDLSASGVRTGTLR